MLSACHLLHPVANLVMVLKFIIQTSSLDPDQTASIKVVLSWSTQFDVGSHKGHKKIVVVVCLTLCILMDFRINWCNKYGTNHCAL